MRVITALFISLFAISAQADVGGLLKGLKNKIEQGGAGSQNTQTRPAQDPLGAHIERYKAQQQQENTKNPYMQDAEMGSGSAAPVASGTVDIKGMKLGMSRDEAMKIARSNLDKESTAAACKHSLIDIHQESYVLGDEVVSCQQFLYFGTTAQVMNAFFIGGKLSYMVLGTFYSESEADQELPAVYKALADKYGVRPSLVKKSRTMKGLEEFTSSIKDSNGDELFVTGELKHDLSGNIQKNVIIGIQVKGHSDIQSQRLQMMQTQASKEQEAEQVRKQKDL